MLCFLRRILAPGRAHVHRPHKGAVPQVEELGPRIVLAAGTGLPGITFPPTSGVRTDPILSQASRELVDAQLSAQLSGASPLVPTPASPGTIVRGTGPVQPTTALLLDFFTEPPTGEPPPGNIRPEWPLPLFLPSPGDITFGPSGPGVYGESGPEEEQDPLPPDPVSPPDGARGAPAKPAIPRQKQDGAQPPDFVPSHTTEPRSGQTVPPEESDAYFSAWDAGLSPVDGRATDRVMHEQRLHMPYANLDSVEQDVGLGVIHELLTVAWNPGPRGEVRPDSPEVSR
jgi:hypothetical protein